MAEGSVVEKAPSPPLEISPSPASHSTVAIKGEADRQDEEEATRVNSRSSIHPVGQHNDSDSHNPEEESNQYLSGRRLYLVHAGLLLSVLLVALDESIVSTALPKLSSQFHALDQLTWVVSTYYLTLSGVMLLSGQVLTIVSSKWALLIGFALFEIGSLLCAVAPSINVLLFGRAVQGVGASGGFIAVLTIVAQVARMDVRPILLGSVGAVFQLANILGPLLGGLFTDKLTWRWCFYINLPLGGLSLLTVVLFLPNQRVPPNPLYDGKPLLQKWLSPDWIGTVLCVGMTITFLLPLTWGGIKRPWNDCVIIVLFVTSAVLFILLVVWERRLGERAMMPLSISIRRTQIGAGIVTFMATVSSTMMIYYLPFFYQAKGHSAVKSGIDVIPFMITAVVGTLISGWLTKVTGRYWPYLIVGPILMAISGGLFFIVDENASNAKLIGYQILYGFGLGICYQIPLIAIQAEYADVQELIPQASSLLTYLQLLGAAIGISVAGAVFGNQLGKGLEQYSSIIPAEVITGVKHSVTIIFTLPDFLQGIVITAYIKAVDYAFLITIPTAGLTLIAGLFVKNWNLKEREGLGDTKMREKEDVLAEVPMERGAGAPPIV